MDLPNWNTNFSQHNWRSLSRVLSAGRHSIPRGIWGTPSITFTYRSIGMSKANKNWHPWAGATNTTPEGFSAVWIATSQPYGYTLGPATWTAAGPKLNWGTVTPSYLVLTVIYSPPGSKSSHGSTFTYEANSTSGTTTSVSTTFKSGVSLCGEHH
jgi:hypothetical protein